MFSRINGVSIRSCASQTLSQKASMDARLKGNGERWPISTPSAFVKAMCSLHQGGFTRCTNSVNSLKYSRFSPSALPRERFSPCGISVKRDRKSSRNTHLVFGDCRKLSAVISRKSIPSGYWSISLRSGSRYPMPTPKTGSDSKAGVMGVWAINNPSCD